MKTMKHTPGPWRFNGSSILAPMPSFDHIEFVTKDGPREILGMKSEILIGYTPWVQFSTGQYDAMMKANATLIAAAPEMLEVCELILKEWEKPTEGIQRGELIARLSQYSIEARAAIKKARGEA